MCCEHRLPGSFPLREDSRCGLVIISDDSLGFLTAAKKAKAVWTITLASQKGGTGKSTLAIGLAVAAMEDGDRQMVEILTSVLSDGLAAVEAACAEALSQGVYSAAVILNILARRRESTAPITIMTPEALKLKHAPTADCARYDSLRRAI